MTDTNDRKPPRKSAGAAKKDTTGSARGKRFREAETGDGSERIAKRLSRAGVSSRREAEALVEAGRVRVNGHLLDSPAVNVRPGDKIEIDGQPIPEIERTRLFLFHKPSGVVTTNRDPEGRRTIFDVLPADLPRLMTIGRLDINTEGLLLLTNDGGLARVLELPQTGWLRRYRVRVHGNVDETALAGLKDGVAVDGVFYGAVEAELERKQGTNAWLVVGLREGKNREVKNIMASLGLEVTRLIRISFGPFQLADLDEGAVRELKGKMLRDQLGPRLIEEAGANFDAPVSTPFSNKPEAAEAPRSARTVERDAPPSLRIEEGGLVRSRKRSRSDARDDALARLDTTAPRGRFGKGDRPERGERPARGDRPFKSERPQRGERSDDKDDRKDTPPRRANVWIGPGGRPQSKKNEAGEAEGPEVRVPRSEWKGRRDAATAAAEAAPVKRARPQDRDGRGGERPRSRKPSDGDNAAPRDWKKKPPRAGKAERQSGEGGPGYEYKPRPRAAAGDEGAERKPYRPREGGEARERKPFRSDGERPARADGERKFVRKPREDGAGGERPSKPYRPREGGNGEARERKPFRTDGERPARTDGERKFVRKPREDGAGGERPSKPYRPREGGNGEARERKPFRSDGERPARADGERKFTRKPGGDRPFGGKPGGRSDGAPRGRAPAGKGGPAGTGGPGGKGGPGAKGSGGPRRGPKRGD